MTMTAFSTRAYPARGGMRPQTMSVVVRALFMSTAVSGVTVSNTNNTIRTWATEKTLIRIMAGTKYPQTPRAITAMAARASTPPITDFAILAQGAGSCFPARQYMMKLMEGTR